MRASSILLPAVIAIGLTASGARAEIYVASAGGTTDLGPTAPREVLDAPSSGSLGSAGVSSTRVVAGWLKGKSFFENPPSCLCTPQGSASTDAHINANDLVITGPPGVVHGVFHLQLEGTLVQGGDYPWGSNVNIELSPEASFNQGGVYLHSNGTLTATGILSGVSGTSVNVTFDLPFDFDTELTHYMTLALSSAAGGTGLGVSANSASSDFFSDVDADGVGGLHFRTGAVTLPAGYTLNSPQLGIVNNSWSPQVPLAVEPGWPAADDLRFAIAPNPATSLATVMCALPREGRVRLEVFTAAGRRVGTIADRAFEAGVHQIPWDARDASGRALEPGLYFARLEFEGRSRVTRVVLLGAGR